MTESGLGCAMAISNYRYLISEPSRRTPEPVSNMTIRALHNHVPSGKRMVFKGPIDGMGLL